MLHALLPYLAIAEDDDGDLLVGNAVDDLSAWRTVSGYGAGVRWSSPIGALSLDLAYGRATEMARALQRRHRIPMTRSRSLLWLVVAGLVLLLGAVLTLRWASRSEAVLRWGLQQLAGRLPCKLDVLGMTGSLTEPVRIELVRCESDALLVKARQVRLDWSPWALQDQRLEIATLAAEGEYLGRMVLGYEKGEVRIFAASIF